MTAIDHRTAIGMARTIKDVLPVQPPAHFDTDERAAFYAGWHECAGHFEESMFRALTTEAHTPQETR